MKLSQTTVEDRSCPPDRLGVEGLRGQRERLCDTLPLDRLFDTVSELVMILNSHRQIVYANPNCRRWLGAERCEGALGKRPGELMGCTRAFLTEGGCGTSDFCRECGAFRAICGGLAGKSVEEECRMMLEEGKGALDLWIRATPLKLSRESFVVVAIRDIGDEKRRKVLERVFFHDILNTAGGIHGLVEVMKDSPCGQREDYLDVLEEVSSQLLEEIQSQRMLLSAENGELAVSPEKVRLQPMLQSIQANLQNQDVGRWDRIVLSVNPDLSLITDRALLHRTLTNMLKNALEASSDWETVTVRAREGEARVRVSVHNLAVMPPKVKRQVFQRSFSTKGEGRGLGTYSMRLLTEEYMRGRISFTSEQGEGTTFELDLPKVMSTATQTKG